MGVTIPLNEELFTTARIVDLTTISERMDFNLIEYISRSNIDMSSERFKEDFKGFKTILEFFLGVREVAEYRTTDTLAEMMNKTISIINTLENGFIPTENEVSIIKSCASLLYTELMEIANNTILPIKKPLEISLVVPELEKAIATINQYSHGNIAKLNSLLYLNTNRLVAMGRMLNNLITEYTMGISKIMVYVDLVNNTTSVAPEKVAVEIKDLSRKIHNCAINIINDKFIEGGISNETVLATTSDADVLKTINKAIEESISIYNTFNCANLTTLFNWDKIPEMESNPSCVHSNLVKLKLAIDLLTCLVVSATDSFNTTLDKLKKSIPLEDQGIEGLDAIE